MREILALLLTLPGCALLPVEGADPPPAAEAVTFEVPAELTTCPKGAEDVPAPPAVRTIEQVLEREVLLDAALAKSEAVRRECTARLKALNVWINEHRI